MDHFRCYKGEKLEKETFTEQALKQMTKTPHFWVAEIDLLQYHLFYFLIIEKQCLKYFLKFNVNTR